MSEKEQQAGTAEPKSMEDRLLDMLQEQMNQQNKLLRESGNNQRTAFRLIVGITIFNTLLIGAFGGLNVLFRAAGTEMGAHQQATEVAAEPAYDPYLMPDEYWDTGE